MHYISLPDYKLPLFPDKQTCTSGSFTAATEAKMVRHRSTVDEKMKLLEEIDAMGNIQRFMSPRMQTTRAVWSVISQQLEGKGVQFSASQCRVTWRDLKHNFFKDLTQQGSTWMVKMSSSIYEKLLEMWNKAGRPEANKSPEDPITSTAEIPLFDDESVQSATSPPKHRVQLRQKTTYKDAIDEKEREQKTQLPKRIKLEDSDDFSGVPSSSSEAFRFSPIPITAATGELLSSLNADSAPGHGTATHHQCMGSAEITAHNSELMSHTLLQMNQTLQDLANSVLRLEHRQEQQQQQIVSLLTQISNSAFSARNSRS
ncbi:hypothetical protein NDU88_003000 [Pleurodeles waltl]|uniref:Myb-like domain-containing protein n=2 Tax=Pleurodeles waltl TaxID=8319 RepID=A0AAV7M448_PLEWA|nr:hypothetical protein NDU88_003000 [Pleurodeles waltl]